MKKLLFFCLVFIAHTSSAQGFWTNLNQDMISGHEELPPLLSVVDDQTVWMTNIESYDHMNPQNENVCKWYCSANGGASWNSGTFAFDNNTYIITSLCAVSQTTAYVTVWAANQNLTTAASGLYKTSDSGATWVRQQGLFDASGVSFADAVHFWNANEGVAMGDEEDGYFEIYTTSDAGANWSRVAPENIPPPIAPGEGALIGHQYLNGNTIRLRTNYGRLLTSSDKGAHWTIYNIPPLMDISGINSGMLAFKDQNIGLFNSSTAGFFKTENGGQSWNPVVANPEMNYAHRIESIWYIPETDNGYFVSGFDFDTGEYGTSYTNDAGLTFQNMNPLDEQPIWVRRAEFKRQDLAYSIGTYVSEGEDSLYFSVFKHDETNAGYPDNLWNESFGILTKQIIAHPNPTKDIVKLSGANITSVDVYDVSGKLLISKTNNGLKEVTLDFSQLQAGAYFAKANGNDNSSTVKVIKN